MKIVYFKSTAFAQVWNIFSSIMLGRGIGNENKACPSVVKRLHVAIAIGAAMSA